MEFKAKPLDLDLLVADAGIQVREKLDTEHVADLVTVIEDNRSRELPAVVVFFDGSTHWLADGFHRRAAHIRAGSQTISAEVRQGSKDAAKLFAAGANTRNGMRLNSGDKKRAILNALATPEGRKMGDRELARHVGCSAQYVIDVKKGCQQLTPDSRRPRPIQPAYAALQDRIDLALREDPSKTDEALSSELSCARNTVSKRRIALGLREPRGAAKARALTILRTHPEWPNARIAEDSGSHKETVAQLREEHSIPKAAE